MPNMKLNSCNRSDKVRLVMKIEKVNDVTNHTCAVNDENET